MLKTVVILLLSAPTLSHSGSLACPITEKPPGYLLFSDSVHGFCFLYPSTYKPVRASTNGYHFHFDDGSRILAKFESGQSRNPGNKDPRKAAVLLFISTGAFNLKSLMSEAPSGFEAPPSPRRFGTLTFYKYGAGGGGVSYDDIFYFNLHGRCLRIFFDGPFIRDKTPSVSTKQIETKMLESFRQF